MLRRSRGHVPESIALPLGASRPLLGCGAELKSTFCVAKGDRAWVGHHIGDLKNYETLCSFRDGVEHFERLFAIEPASRRPRPAPRLPLDRLRALARGGRAGRRPAPPRAPGRLPGRARRARPGGRARSSTAAATGPTPRSGAARSCVGDLAVVRARRVPVPGPPARRRRRRARTLADGLRLAGRGPRARSARRSRRRSPRAVEPRRWETACELAAGGLNSPLTTSAGRLFDAVAALCGAASAGQLRGPGRDRARGRRCGTARRPYPIGLIDPGPDGPLIIDPRATIRAVGEDVAAGVERGDRRRALPRGAGAARPRKPARWSRAAAGSSSWSSPAACSRTGSCSSAPPS